MISRQADAADRICRALTVKSLTYRKLVLETGLSRSVLTRTLRALKRCGMIGVDQQGNESDFWLWWAEVRTKARWGAAMALEKT